MGVFRSLLDSQREKERVVWFVAEGEREREERRVLLFVVAVAAVVVAG